MPTIQEESITAHAQWKGKLDTIPKMKIDSAHDLSVAYTPGVAEPCKRIHENREDVYKYTWKGNTIAIVTDGTAVLGLGDIGPEAALPVMEGKAVLFREFGGINAVPICLATKEVDAIVEAVRLISPGFGGINLEDIAAPRCFEVEKKLQSLLDIPVFHDDQHGTAIVVLAAVTNALRLVKKSKKSSRIVINGAGSAGIACSKILQRAGFDNLVLCDKSGVLEAGAAWMNWAQEQIAASTNPEKIRGNLATALQGADVFIGVSAPNIVSAEMIKSMNKDAIVFAMANPVPEIMPDLAKAAGARVVGTGRSDFPNQVNNVLAFPGIFRGALECRAPQITEEMKLAAAQAIAQMVSDAELQEDYLLPKAFNREVAIRVSEAIQECHRKSKTAELGVSGGC